MLPRLDVRCIGPPATDPYTSGLGCGFSTHIPLGAFAIFQQSQKNDAASTALCLRSSAHASDLPSLDMRQIMQPGCANQIPLRNAHRLRLPSATMDIELDAIQLRRLPQAARSSPIVGQRRIMHPPRDERCLAHSINGRITHSTIPHRSTSPPSPVRGRPRPRPAAYPRRCRALPCPAPRRPSQ